MEPLFLFMIKFIFHRESHFRGVVLEKSSLFRCGAFIILNIVMKKKTVRPCRKQQIFKITPQEGHFGYFYSVHRPIFSAISSLLAQMTVFCLKITYIVHAFFYNQMIKIIICPRIRQSMILGAVEKSEPLIFPCTV